MLRYILVTIPLFFILQSSKPQPIFELLSIPLQQCQVVLYSLDIDPPQSTTADSDAEHLFVEQSALSFVPLVYRQFRITAENSDLTHLSHVWHRSLARVQSRCSIYVTFVEPATTNTAVEVPDWARPAKNDYSSEHDFAVLGISSTSNFPPKTTDSYYASKTPENLILLSYRRDTTLTATHIGSYRTYCSASSETCAIWWPIESLPPETCTSRNLFLSLFGLRSSYFSAHGYNFNLHAIYNSLLFKKSDFKAFKLYQKTRYFEIPSTRHLLRHLKSLTSEQSEKYQHPGTLRRWIEHTICTMMNATLKILSNRNEEHRVFINNPLLVFMGGISRAVPMKYGYYFMMRYIPWIKLYYGFVCSRQKQVSIDIQETFRHIDIWSCVSLLLVAAFSLLFLRSSSAIFEKPLRALMRHRNVLILTWIVGGMFIDFIISTYYGSFLVSPTPIVPKLSFKDMHQQNYIILRYDFDKTYLSDDSSRPADGDQQLEDLQLALENSVALDGGNGKTGTSRFSKEMRNYPGVCMACGTTIMDVFKHRVDRDLPGVETFFGDETRYFYWFYSEVGKPNQGILYRTLNNLRVLGFYEYWNDITEQFMKFLRRSRLLYDEKVDDGYKFVSVGYHHEVGPTKRDVSDITISFSNPQCYLLVYAWFAAVGACLVVFVGEQMALWCSRRQK